MGPDLRAALDNCRLVPETQHQWFQLNIMQLYNSFPGELHDDVSNGIALRADLHRLLDNAVFSLIPANNDFVVQFMGNPGTYEKYHHAKVALHDRVPNQFLYARFAYNIVQVSRQNQGIAMLKPVPLPSGAMSVSPPTPASSRNAASNPPSEPSDPEIDHHEQGMSKLRV